MLLFDGDVLDAFQFHLEFTNCSVQLFVLIAETTTYGIQKDQKQKL
jgi:hypothetical protein